MALSDESGSQLGDVDILTPGVDATNGSQRTCMFRHEGNAHGIFPNPPG
jgi:hypothetical protein